MHDHLGGSWLPTRSLVQAGAPAPNPLRRIFVPWQDLENAVGTSWRTAARVILPGLTGGVGDPEAFAAASGYTLLGDATSAALTYVVPKDDLAVVDEVVIRPASDLGYEYLKAALVDGGSGANFTTGRVGDVLRYDLPLPIDGSGVLPVRYQVGGGVSIFLVLACQDPEAPHAVEVEMRGRIFQADQFRNGR